LLPVDTVRQTIVKSLYGKQSLESRFVRKAALFFSGAKRPQKAKAAAKHAKKGPF